MRRSMLRWRAVIAVAAALVMGAVATPSAASASDAILPQKFAADSGDRCRFGYTEGILSWQWSRVGPQALATAVNLSGVLVDEPSASPSFVCRDDRYYTVATYVAYSGSTVVDRRAARVDNSAVRIDITLGGTTSAAGIARLVVQVCRSPLLGTGISYCGEPRSYAPVIT